MTIQECRPFFKELEVSQELAVVICTLGALMLKTGFCYLLSESQVFGLLDFHHSGLGHIHGSLEGEGCPFKFSHLPSICFVLFCFSKCVKCFTVCQKLLHYIISINHGYE